MRLIRTPAEKAARKARRAARQPAGAVAGSLRVPRLAALITIAAVIAAASLTSFAESYRGLFDWAREHGLSGLWAAAWPLQLDTFIAVGELALFVALADRWAARSRIGAWGVTLLGLAASVAGNIGHVHSRLLSDRATAAVPPLAAAAALAVGLGVLKRVVQAHHPSASEGGSAARSATATQQEHQSAAQGASASDGALVDDRQMHPQSPARSGSRRPEPVTDADAEVHFAADLAAGEVPSARRIQRELHVGQSRAGVLRERMQSITAGQARSNR